VLATLLRDGLRRLRGAPARARDSPRDAADFILMQSAVGAANLVFNLVALFSLARARSGTMAAVTAVGGTAVDLWSAPMSPPDLLTALLLGTLACLPLCYAGTRALGAASGAIYAKLPPRALAAAVFAGLTALVFVLEGPTGLAVAAAALCLGLVPPVAGIKRVHLMGAVLVPVALRLAAGTA
jgi:putative membrane protein